MNLKFLYLLLLLSAVCCVSCSKDEEPADKGNTSPEEPVYTTFTDAGEVIIPGVLPANLTPRSVRVKGDTLFVANNNAADRSVLLLNLTTGELIGRIDSWMRKDTKETFNAEIGDMAVSDRYIFVGMYNSRINVFDRRTLQFVNAIGRSDGKWGDDIYSMTHCYGLRECGERLMVRDKNTIRGYWIYEAVTEPAFRVPWIGKVKVPEGIGYDYQPRIHGMAEHNGRMYLTDWYNKSLQVFTPSKMEIVFGEETHITSDAVFKYDAIQPLGLLSYGGELLMSVQKSGKIQRYDPETGDLLGLLAEFPDKEIGRMEIARGMLYYIDLKAGKLMKAKGE